MAKKDWLLGDSPNPLGDRVDEIRGKFEGQKPGKIGNKNWVAL